MRDRFPAPGAILQMVRYCFLILATRPILLSAKRASHRSVGWGGSVGRLHGDVTLSLSTPVDVVCDESYMRLRKQRHDRIAEYTPIQLLKPPVTGQKLQTTKATLRYFARMGGKYLAISFDLNQGSGDTECNDPPRA